MSVSLLIRDARGAEQRLVPVAAQAIFKAKWLPGARELGLDWVDLMETGYDVTSENRAEVLNHVRCLRDWMVKLGETYELERLDRLVAEVEAIDFNTGATAFIG